MNTEPRFIEATYPEFKVVLCTLGASIYSIQVNDVEMLSTFANQDEWLYDTSYHGKTIGRIAGRIPMGVFNIGKKMYFLDRNEKGNTLHGGKEGLSFKNFDVEFKQHVTHSEIIFTYTSPDGEGGFPGKVKFKITYHVFKDKTIEIYHEATTDKKTPVSLTQHLYFNLGEENLNNINMQVKAQKRYYLDEQLLKRRIVPVKNTSYDFTKMKPVMQDAFNDDVKGICKNGFDDIWYFENEKKGVIATLESPKYRADFYSNYNAAVIYMNGFPSHKMLTTGRTEEVHSAITMELTNGEPQMINPLKPYLNFTKIVFKEKN